MAEDRVVLGASSVDYIPVGASLADPESRDLIRFLWPAALVKRETVKYLYSQDGHEYLWQSNLSPTHANNFTVNALMIPFEFLSKREPDLPNTLGKIAVIVGDREYPIMVDFWDALKRFEEAYKNLPLNTLRWVVGFGMYVRIPLAHPPHYTHVPTQYLRHFLGYRPHSQIHSHHANAEAVQLRRAPKAPPLQARVRHAEH